MGRRWPRSSSGPGSPKGRAAPTHDRDLTVVDLWSPGMSGSVKDRSPDGDDEKVASPNSSGRRGASRLERLAWILGAGAGLLSFGLSPFEEWLASLAYIAGFLAICAIILRSRRVPSAYRWGTPGGTHAGIRREARDRHRRCGPARVSRIPDTQANLVLMRVQQSAGCPLSTTPRPFEESRILEAQRSKPTSRSGIGTD